MCKGLLIDCSPESIIHKENTFALSVQCELPTAIWLSSHIHVPGTKTLNAFMSLIIQILHIPTKIILSLNLMMFFLEKSISVILINLQVPTKGNIIYHASQSYRNTCTTLWFWSDCCPRDRLCKDGRPNRKHSTLFWTLSRIQNVSYESIILGHKAANFLFSFLQFRIG